MRESLQRRERDVNDLTGRVGLLLDKTRGLVDLLIAVLALPTVNQSLMQQLAGLLIPSIPQAYLSLFIGRDLRRYRRQHGAGGNKATSTCAGRDCGSRAILTHRLCQRSLARGR